MIFVKVTVEMTGCIERFLNEIRKNKLVIYGLCKTDEGKIRFAVYRYRLDKILSLADKCGMKYSIISEKGFALKLIRYRKRYGFFIGAAICLLVIFISSLFVWDIKVTGNEKLSEYDIISRLEKSGFRRGMLINKVEASKVENRFLTDLDEVSWMAINIKGTTAYVEIREIDKPPELLDTSEPSSIYAVRDGVIASVDDYMGYSVVEKGDTVSAGDLLVTGNYTDKYGVEYKLHSMAKVMAYTVHTNSVFVPFLDSEHIKTGKEYSRYSLKLTRFIIPLYFREKIIYNNYDVTKNQKTLSITDNFVLPVEILKTTYTEISDAVINKSREVALAEAYEKIYNKEYDFVGLNILNKEYQEIESDDGITVKAIYECYEDIGISRKIG